MSREACSTPNSWRKTAVAATAASLLTGSCAYDVPVATPNDVDRILVYNAYGPEGTVEIGDDSINTVRNNLHAAWQELNDASGLVSPDVKVKYAGKVVLEDIGPFSNVCDKGKRRDFVSNATRTVREEHDDDIEMGDMLVLVFKPEKRMCTSEDDSDASMIPATAIRNDVVVLNGAYFAKDMISAQEDAMHEYGHAVLDLAHNDLLQDCEVTGEEGIRINNTCDIVPHGDKYTIMGRRPALVNDHLFHAFEQRRLRFLEDEQVLSLSEPGEHSVDLYALGNSEEGPQVVRIPLAQEMLGQKLFDRIKATALYIELSPALQDGLGVKMYLVNEEGAEDREATESYLLAAKNPNRAVMFGGDSTILVFDGLQTSIKITGLEQDSGKGTAKLEINLR